MTRVLRRRARRQAGFTLIELLMGIALGSLFAIALYGFFFTGLDTARSQQTQAIAQSTGRTAIDRIASDIRQSVSPDDGLTAPVIQLDPVTLVVYVDPDRSAANTTPKPERVRYWVTGGQLVRERQTPIGVAPPYSYSGWGGKEVLIENVQNGAVPAFSAVTEKGAALPATVLSTQYRDVAQITVRLLVGQMTGAKATTLELTTDVALRNAIDL